MNWPAPNTIGNPQAKRRRRNVGLWVFLAIAATAIFVLCLPYLANSKAFAFVDVGSDTFFCFYPLQVAVARQLQNLHVVTWSFELGLGGYLGTLFDPLWLLTGWLPDSWQLALRLPMFALRLLLGGGFFYAYLRQLGFRTPIAVLGGLGYTFSSYGLISAQWEILHGTEYVQFAAYLFLLERFIGSRRRWAGISAGIVVGLGHPIGLYMFTLFSIVYGAIRLMLAGRGKRRDIAIDFAAFAAWCIVGLALTAPLLFPALHYFLESPRVSGEHALVDALLPSLLSSNDAATISSELAGLVGKDLLGTSVSYIGWANWFEGPGFYMGLLPLFCIPQLFGPRASRSERTVVIIGLIGCALYFVWPALRYAVYGFGHTGFRFSTLWIGTLLLVLGLAGLQRALLSAWWRPGIVMGIVAIMAVMLGAALLGAGPINSGHAIRVASFTLLYAALAWLATSAPDRPGLTASVLLAVCACELLTMAIPALVDRNAVKADGSSTAGRYDDDTLLALATISELDADESFWRIEKTYSSVFLDDAMIQQYPGTASYYFHSAAVTRFVDRMKLPRPAQSPNYISPMTARATVLSLLAVKYVLSRGRSLDKVPAMTYVRSVGKVDIYRNDSATEFGRFYDAINAESDADAMPLPQRDVFLLSAAVVEYPDATKAKLDSLAKTPAVPGLARKSRIIRVRDDLLQGQVGTPTAALLLLQMPFDQGWKGWLDGRPVELQRADYGLTAALVPPGKHTIELAYVPPGRTIGVALTAGIATFFSFFEFLPWLTRKEGRMRTWLSRLARIFVGRRGDQ